MTIICRAAAGPCAGCQGLGAGVNPGPLNPRLLCVMHVSPSVVRDPHAQFPCVRSGGRVPGGAGLRRRNAQRRPPQSGALQVCHHAAHDLVNLGYRVLVWGGVNMARPTSFAGEPPQTLDSTHEDGMCCPHGNDTCGPRCTRMVLWDMGAPSSWQVHGRRVWLRPCLVCVNPASEVWVWATCNSGPLQRLYKAYILLPQLRCGRTVPCANPGPCRESCTGGQPCSDRALRTTGLAYRLCNSGLVAI